MSNWLCWPWTKLATDCFIYVWFTLVIVCWCCPCALIPIINHQSNSQILCCKDNIITVYVDAVHDKFSTLLIKYKVLSLRMCLRTCQYFPKLIIKWSVLCGVDLFQEQPLTTCRKECCTGLRQLTSMYARTLMNWALMWERSSKW